LLLRGWQYLKWPPIERFTGPVDLVHSPASYFPPARAARRVMTVHDLYFHHAPGHVEPYGGAYFAQTFRHSLPQAAHIIAISQFTRQELLRFYTMPEDRISVIPQGVDCTRFRPEPQADDNAQLERLGIEKPYLLSVATIEPRKNLVTLIEAYARARQILRAAHQRLPRLVIVGLHGWGLQALKERLYEARLDSGEVHLTGYVPDAALPALYRHAFGLVFPSLYEGFGMPVLEAMASGCPTAVANTSALPEVGGEAAAYFNPRDSDALARLLARFLGDPLLRQNLREAGFARAAQFSWQATARATLDVYRHVLST
jgi:alpha-1,3-rhamnosyl/mannosyltransferase